MDYVDCVPQPVMDPPRVRGGTPPPVLRSRFSDDWIMFGQVGGRRLGVESSVVLATAMHKAILAHTRGPIPGELSGHADVGRLSPGPHMALVPLPDIGQRHSRGELRGLAVVVPRGLGRGVRRTLEEALQRFERAGAVLRMGRSGRWVMRRVDTNDGPDGGRAEPWCRASRGWTSASAVVLDRYPGDLKASGPTRRARAEARARRTICEGCVRLGLPAPVEVSLASEPILTGAIAAYRSPSYPMRGPARVRIHVRLRFAEVVRGPIVLGAGRYRGLGLLRPDDPR